MGQTSSTPPDPPTPDPALWARAKAIFEVLRTRPDAEDREELLTTLAGGDEALADHVRDMLSNDSTAFLSEPALGEGLAGLVDGIGTEHDPLIGESIGRYRVRRLIATGGMGRVYEAVQQTPRRTVALKVMRRDLASRTAMRRFEFESQILSRMHHPNMATVHDAGVHDDGRGGVPWFAMEYLPDAKPITEHCRTKKCSVEERLHLFAKVCDAVHHGHLKGVVHRDLKPSNILVDAATNEPKVIDFGVARSTDSDLAVTTLQTNVGDLIGTIQYMSPEQVGADPHNIDARSDVYALGLVLYELLAGRVPYQVGSSMIDGARVVREVEPPPLSKANRKLRGDLEAIVGKALQKDRDKRYQSAEALKRDIERHLQGDPIEARRLGRLRMWLDFSRVTHSGRQPHSA